MQGPRACVWRLAVLRQGCAQTGTGTAPAAPALAVALGTEPGPIAPAHWWTELIIKVMVEAPNRGRKLDPNDGPGGIELGWPGVDQQFRVPVGPPEASRLV